MLPSTGTFRFHQINKSSYSSGSQAAATSDDLQFIPSLPALNRGRDGKEKRRFLPFTPEDTTPLRGPVLLRKRVDRIILAGAGASLSSARPPAPRVLASAIQTQHERFLTPRPSARALFFGANLPFTKREKAFC